MKLQESHWLQPWEYVKNGLVITIEPMIAEHPALAVEDCDGWTMRTSNGSLSAHFEHTVVITDDRPILLTAAFDQNNH